MNIPNTLRAGDTWSWTESLSDYPAPTYTLKFSFWRYGQAVKTITATASGVDHAIAAATTTTVTFASGTWQWTAYAEKGSGATLERYTVDSGTATIKPCLASTGSTADLRSHAQKMLDAIEAMCEGRASHAELSLTINGKAIQYLKPAEIFQWRSFYRGEVAKEQRDEKIARGDDPGKRIVTRFGS